MNNIFRKLTCIGALLLSLQGGAAAQSSSVITPWATIEEIQTAIGSRSDIFVKLTGVDPSLYNPGGCSQVGGFRAKIRFDGNSDLKFEILLQAVAQGREVRLNIEDCYKAKPEIVGVQIR